MAEPSRYASDRAADAGEDAGRVSRRNSNRRPAPPPAEATPEGERLGRPRGHRSGDERLYEAYSELHTLAQNFNKPFDAPAILVVGHQTDGKSALIEALMGFQFNHVGGGTKTRRPITLHMAYKRDCVQPQCTLLSEEGGERELSLEDLQEHIEMENQRLDAENQFWAKEIVVKICYKYCPNLTIIDTPGLISAAPGKRNAALQHAAKQVEAMVLDKMRTKEFIILALEDTSDWNNATTRRTVMQVDPTLSRTALVSTKLDTRIPQFATPSDVENFLHPPGLEDCNMLGGTPFFTSVPSGRVGSIKDAVFRSNDHFREAVATRQERDAAELESKLGRKLQPGEMDHIGVHKLRKFLEGVLQRCYLENVPAIVPALEKEYRSVAAQLAATRTELGDLQHDRLKDKGRHLREQFLTELQLLLRGTVAAPAERFGETLADEHMRGGAFVGPDGQQLPLPANLANVNMRLFGGAQFHRAVAEFRMAVGQMVCPDISREEIVNACGMDDVHDGVNYVRTACVIAVSKARDIFEPFVHQLGYRLAHVLRRLLPVAMFLLHRSGACLNGFDQFLKRVGACYHAFIDEVERACKARCLEDLASTTRYVNWSLHTKNTKTLQTLLAKSQVQPDARATPQTRDGRGGGGGAAAAAAAADASRQQSVGVLMDILDCTLWQRSLNATSEEIIAALVCQVFEGIRDHMVQACELKFHCFFLMPVVDAFPTVLRSELEGAYEEDGEDVFDVVAVRAALEQRQRVLEQELHQVERLQHKFALIHATLAQQQQQQAASLPERTAADYAERVSLMSLADSASITALGARLKASAGSRRAAVASGGTHVGGGGASDAAPPPGGA